MAVPPTRTLTVSAETSNTGGKMTDGLEKYEKKNLKMKLAFKKK